MIIFAITTNVELIRKPDWLDSFLVRHNKIKFDYHVTLKQPCIIEESQIPQIKMLLEEYFKKTKTNPISIIFNELDLEASQEELENSKACIMINAKDNEEIRQLQKDVVEVFREYTNYVDPESKTYEENFIPHITIAYDLNAERYDLAKKNLVEDYVCEGQITQLILTVVDKTDLQDKKLEDKIYNL